MLVASLPQATRYTSWETQSDSSDLHSGNTFPLPNRVGHWMKRHTSIGTPPTALEELELSSEEGELVEVAGMR